MSLPAWVTEQREDGSADALGALAEIMLRFPDASLQVTGIYRSPRQFREPWYRVSVKVGTTAAFAPRFEAFDDATSFRRGALAMADAR